MYNINVSCYYYYCYVSRKLFPREQRCNIIEKECLTVKRAAETLWHYLPGNEFTLVTDHYSLLQMNQMKDRNTRITQQYLYFTVSEFKKQTNKKVARYKSKDREAWHVKRDCLWQDMGRKANFL